MTIVSNVINGVANLVWYPLALAVAAYLAKVYRDYARLRNFKGPWLSGWTDLWLVRSALGLQTHEDFARVCKKYGKRRVSASSNSLFSSDSALQFDISLVRMLTHVLSVGPIARVAPNILITSSPELMFRMNAARSPYTKGSWYAGLQMPPGQDNLFSQVDEKKHTLRRAQMADGVRRIFIATTIKSLAHPAIVFRQNELHPRKHHRLPSPQSD
jgi:hypothetical protein